MFGKLHKLHRSYLFSKYNCLIIVILIILILIVMLIGSQFYIKVDEQIMYEKEYQSFYNHLFLIIIKMIMPLFSCYFFCYGFIKNNGYSIILKTPKWLFLLSKIIVIIESIIILGISSSVIYILCGLLTKWFVINYFIFVNLLIIIIISIVFGLLSFLISYLINNMFGLCIAYSMYLLSELIKDFDIWIINLFLPTFNEETKHVLLSEYFGYFLVFILYFGLSFLLYESKELK